MEKSIAAEKSFDTAVAIVNLYKSLIYHQKEYVLSRQLLKAGTSIGANIREAQNGESKSDYIHKMGIAQKECSETLYWLELLKATNYLHDEIFCGIYDEVNDLLKIIRSIIITSKKNISKL